MKSVKEQFEEFKTTTPKHIQWLLLIAAFIVVVILLTLLVQDMHGKKSKKTSVVEDTVVEMLFEPTSLDFSNVDVEKTKTDSVTVSVNDVVFIDDVKIETANTKDWHINTDCDNKITQTCEINLTYKPTTNVAKTTAYLVVAYHLPNNEYDIETKKIPVVFSANEVIKEAQIVEEQNTIETEPIVEQESTQELLPEPEIEIPTFQEEAEEEISVIAPEKPFENTEPTRMSDIILPSEKCSDFAIPGYNQSGVQIGWIKPSKGTNYFHPFSDKDCSKPTGKYDWTTGIITSLRDGSKIGTDADHIGFRNVKSRGLSLPSLSSPKQASLQLPNGQFDDTAVWGSGGSMKIYSDDDTKWQNLDLKNYEGSAESDERVVSSNPYDRTFILRQFKPIPATIVSEVRADPSVYGCSSVDGAGPCDEKRNHSIPVRATVDRNVYSDDGRTIIVPTGTLLMGYLEGNLPGPYQSFGRMNIKWYQFIRPDGVEFNFPNTDSDPYSGDAQGRVGVPGRGSTDYVEQMVMPILTAIVPAAVNMIAPIADTFVNQINLDNNTVVQSGTMRSSEMAKQEIINTWNKITNKLVVDAISNTVPPFSIPAGTRINVYSPVDLVVTCGDKDQGKKCAFLPYGPNPRRKWADLKREVTVNKAESSWVGQVRSWDLEPYCDQDKDGKWIVGDNWASNKYGYDYRTILLYCESRNYVSKNMAKNAVYTDQQNKKYAEKYGNAQYEYNQSGVPTLDQSGLTDEQKKAYNEDILGLEYADDGETIKNPFGKDVPDTSIEEALTCDDGSAPDTNGCCTGETYTDMGDQGFNCCPDSGGDCFPPIIVE